MRKRRQERAHERGVVLIIVILILTFMAAVGFALIAVTRTGPDVAGNVRWRQQVLNAAEAGVDGALRQISETMLDFNDQYRTTFNGQDGLDNPTSENYFRKLTDKQLVDDVLSNPDHYIFASQPLPDDSRLTYTAFLISDEAPGASPNHMDAILVCIGKGPQNTYVRIEILIEMEEASE